MCRMEKFPGHGLCPDFSGPGRPARSMHIPGPVPVLVPNFHLSPFPIWKSLIGRFSNRKWAVNRSWRPFPIWKSTIGRFQIGNVSTIAPTGVLRVFRGIRFYLHRDFCWAEIGILSTQRIRGGDLEENRHFIEGKLVAHGQISIFEKFPRCAR